MRFLVPVGGVTDAYGILTSPDHLGVPAGIREGLPWAADVGCLDGQDFVKRVNFDKVLNWLRTMEPYKETCVFIAGFDVVGKAQDTLDAYEEFSRYLTADLWPVAYVAQNGSEELPIPESCTAVFIGGVPMDDRKFRRSKDYSGKMHDLDWKESMEAVSVIKRAQAMGKHIHIGRVNYWRKYSLFNVLEGSENFTCDGTRTRKCGTDKTIEAWKSYEAQPPLIQI